MDHSYIFVPKKIDQHIIYSKKIEITSKFKHQQLSFQNSDATTQVMIQSKH